MNESSIQPLLTQANKWVDRYGHAFNPDAHLSAISYKISRLPRDPQARLDLVTHLALHTGSLWRNNPTVFTTGLVAPPDRMPDLEGAEYDKYVLETIVNRCAQQPRRADVNLGAGWYMACFDLLDAGCFDGPDNSDENIIETIYVFFEALLYEHTIESAPQLLDTLLSNAWELYLRAWEQNAY